MKEFCGEGMDEAALQAEMDKICNELKAEAEAEVLKEAPVVPETAPAEEAAPAPAEEKAPAEEEAAPEESMSFRRSLMSRYSCFCVIFRTFSKAVVIVFISSIKLFSCLSCVCLFCCPKLRRALRRELTEFGKSSKTV